MQTTAGPAVTNFTTVSMNTTTKSKEQILTQSSGAMIAVIVIGIIIILTILLIILKTYNRRTHVSRVLGGSKPRKKSSSTVQTNVPVGTVGTSSVSGSFAHSHATTENGFQLPRVDMNSLEENNAEQRSTASGSTVVTIHSAPSLENT